MSTMIPIRGLVHMYMYHDGWNSYRWVQGDAIKKLLL